jgi:lipoate-protein ligase A
MQPLLCRLLPFHVAPGPWNMAADEVLLETATAGVASLRFYGWSQPTISLGYFQAEAACRASPHLGDLAWVRRTSGGAALVHHLEVTYALALPAGPPWQKHGQSWLRRMHVILTDALASLGVYVNACDEERKMGDVLCFLHHTPGDLILAGAKVVGSAQRKQRGALMQHGSILLAASPATPNLLGIRELAGFSIAPAEFCSAAAETFRRSSACALQAADWTAGERRRVEELLQIKYAQSWWNHKR